MAKQQHMSFSLEGLMKQVGEQKYPPVEKWNPDFCGDIDMRIAADGTWFYMGTPITRSRMVKLFASVLRKDDDAQTYLVTPVEKVGITVDDAHFIAVDLEAGQNNGTQILVFETNVGDKIVADKEHSIRVVTNKETGEPRPYIKVRGNLDALISRNVFYQLVELAHSVEREAGTELIVESDGEAFSLGLWSDDEC